MSTSGVLLVDKPAGITSHKVVSILSRAYGWKKIGHGGTLDPFATGLLVVLVGEATKISDLFLGGNKKYLATMSIGFETNTCDIEGEQIGEQHEDAIAKEHWEAERSNFLGKIQQQPPIFSAIKVKGQALYRYARRGETVDIPWKTVDIQNLQINKYDPAEIVFDVACSGGTYIRSLARDWARAVGTAAHLKNLQRTESGLFQLAQAQNLEALETKKVEPKLISIREATQGFPQIECNAESAKLIRFGQKEVLQKLSLENKKLLDESEKRFALINHNQKSLALLRREQDSYTLQRVFN